eukprot:GHVR01086216.1.p1 GENE.GHVR01086216.1~~GHVR01086216.1.p1  ORF type:complete len:216 (+),score=61.83 GHVR01086216.1:48-695(+)
MLEDSGMMAPSEGQSEESEYNDDNDDENDPIIAEYKVELTRIEDGELHLLQYPLRPVYRPYGDHGQLSTVEYRKNQKSFKITYTRVREPDNFNHDAEYADIDRHILISTPSGSGDSNPIPKPGTIRNYDNNVSFAFGIIKGDTFYISPISTVSQLRPTFDHVDYKDKINRERCSNIMSQHINNNNNIDNNNKNVCKTKEVLQFSNTYLIGMLVVK